jgi:hypothetical protein
MARLSKAERGERYRQLQKGIQKHLSSGATLRGKAWSQAQLVSAMQQLIDAFDDTTEAKAAYRTALARRGKVESAQAQLVADLIEFVHVTHGALADAMADFDLPMRKKKGPKSTQAKMQMAVRAKETRRLRGTMGKRQRKKVERG